jgi:hypothetical protein
MKYWLCIHRGHTSNTQDNYEEVYPQVGSLFVSKKNEKPPKIHEEDKWTEISQEDYENAMNKEDYIIKYDGQHCVGKCTECKEYIKKKKLCNEDDHIVTNPNSFKSCCIFND